MYFNTNGDKLKFLNLDKPLTQAAAQGTSIAPSKANNENLNEPEASCNVIFGQNLTDRVINVLSPVDLDKESNNDVDTEKGKDENGQASLDSKNKPASALWSSSNENEFAEKNEIDDMNTILKINCKLYVLESEKSNWAERGYGIFKLIDTPDETNCKMSLFLFFFCFNKCIVN